MERQHNKSGSSRVAELVVRVIDRYQLKIVQVYAPTTSHSDEETVNFYNIIDKILEKKTHYTIAMGDLMRKLEDKQIHQKGRQNASAWSSEMKEETNHCLILYRHLILPDLSSKMRPCCGKRCTEEEEEALLYFIIIYNLASTHYPIQPVWEWHKRSLRVNTRLQRESAINTILSLFISDDN